MDFMFTVFPIIFMLFFGLFFAVFISVIVSNVRRESQNNHSLTPITGQMLLPL